MGNRPGNIIHKLKTRKATKRRFSKSSSQCDATLTTENTQLETFLLVWLDPHVDSSAENVETQKRLREILTCLITFDNVETCELWLKKCCWSEKIILIVSGAYGQEIVPKVHHLSIIITIHIYCLDVDRNKIWAKNFSKIQGVQSSTNDLIKELSHTQINLESVEDSKALQIYKHEEQIYSLDAKTASFIAYQLLFEILISSDYIPSKGTFHEFIQILRQYSSDDQYGSNLIDEFEQSYEPKRAASWLIRDTPLARFVNKALREQDMNMLFALRFLLVDIHTQLIENQAQSLNVFKLQLMSKSVMEDLKVNPCQLMTINGFSFASTNMPQLMSTVTNNETFETVLFDIQADFRQGVVPFAFFRHIDSNIEEQIDREVLFMCGAIFEVGPLTYDNDMWRLQLRLFSGNDSTILFNMKQKLKENRNLCIVGDLLYQCDQGENATIYYHRLLDELPQQHTLVPKINEQLTTDNSKSNLASGHNVAFVLVNLSEHLNKFVSSVLNILCTLTSNLIFIIDGKPPIDYSKWSKKSTSIFTTTQVASSSKKLPKHCKIFLLDNGNDHKDQQRFATIDDLICRLADEIIQMYRMESSEYTKIGDLVKAKEQDEQANRIFRELRKIDEKLTKTSDSIAPTLVWLFSNTENNHDDATIIEKTFDKNFSSYLTFDAEEKCYNYINSEENVTDVFLIINRNCRESFANGLRRLPIVKHVYRYDPLKNENDQIITNRDDLCYHLTFDLIDYYRKLGEHYRTNNQSKKARDMFSQAQKLCHFLSTFCFSPE